MNIPKNIEIVNQAELFSDEVYSHFEEFEEYNIESENFKKKVYYISPEYLIYLHINKELDITTINTRNFKTGNEKRVWIKKEMIDAYVINLINRLEMKK